MAIDVEAKVLYRVQERLGPEAVEFWCAGPAQVLLVNARGETLCQFDGRQSVVVIKDMTGGRGRLARTPARVLTAAERAACSH